MRHIILTAILLAPGLASAQKIAHRGDVTDVRVIRRVEQHPQAWRVWQPVIIKGDKKKQLLVAFGAMRNGKKDMGDIFVTLSKDDGDTWELRPLPLGQEGKMYSLVADSNDRLFLGSGGLLLRSDDAAQTWIILDAGIDGVSVYDLREGPDGLLAAATSAGIFTSTDGGDTWDASELH